VTRTIEQAAPIRPRLNHFFEPPQTRREKVDHRVPPAEAAQESEPARIAAGVIVEAKPAVYVEVARHIQSMPEPASASPVIEPQAVKAEIKSGDRNIDMESRHAPPVRQEEATRLAAPKGVHRIESQTFYLDNARIVHEGEPAPGQAPAQSSSLTPTAAVLPGNPMRPSPAAIVMKPEVRPSAEPARRPDAAAIEAESTESAETIRITIGRIDVRAVMPANASVERAGEPSSPRGISLEQYLKRRNGTSHE
jgi:hypothetical protein